MTGRKITALVETRSGWIVAACEDGTLWVKAGPITSPLDWEEIQGPPTEPPQKASSFQPKY